MNKEKYLDSLENRGREESSMVGHLASQKEREELAEEGIDLISIPWVNKDN